MEERFCGVREEDWDWRLPRAVCQALQHGQSPSATVCGSSGGKSTYLELILGSDVAQCAG